MEKVITITSAQQYNKLDSEYNKLLHKDEYDHLTKEENKRLKEIQKAFQMFDENDQSYDDFLE